MNAVGGCTIRDTQITKAYPQCSQTIFYGRHYYMQKGALNATGHIEFAESENMLS
jgi:hypothetical protein